LVNMSPLSTGETEFLYHSPTRVLLGLRTSLLTLTKGTVLYNSIILGYDKLGKLLPKLRRGVLIADQAGETLAYGLANAEGRGTLFVAPATKVYEGMIVGLNSKEEDITMNVCKGKKLTNMRSKASDGVLQLTPPTIMSLEQCLDFLEDDELLEITPITLRLRKKVLSSLLRKRSTKN
jgi:GTP-binding protein